MFKGVHIQNLKFLIKISLSIMLGLVFYMSLISSAKAEEIKLLNISIEVSDDGTFTVTEKIDYDFEDTEKYGISRYILTNHIQPASSWYKNRYIDINVLSVNRDGVSEPYTLSEENNQIYLQIGDSNKIITGEHIYEIKYEVNGGLSYFLNGDSEIYWNVNGDKWDILIRRIEVELFDSDSIFLDGRSCYRRESAESGSCNPILTKEDSIFFSANYIIPGEEIIFSQSINQSKVERVILERLNVFFIWIPSLLILFFVIIVFIYRHKTKYKINVHET